MDLNWCLTCETIIPEDRQDISAYCSDTCQNWDSYSPAPINTSKGAIPYGSGGPEDPGDWSSRTESKASLPGFSYSNLSSPSSPSFPSSPTMPNFTPRHLWSECTSSTSLHSSLGGHGSGGSTSSLLPPPPPPPPPPFSSSQAIRRSSLSPTSTSFSLRDRSWSMGREPSPYGHALSQDQDSQGSMTQGSPPIPSAFHHPLHGQEKSPPLELMEPPSFNECLDMRWLVQRSRRDRQDFPPFRTPSSLREH